MVNFTDALNTPVEEIERPPLMPVGTYRWAVSKVPEFSEIDSPNFQANVVTFMLKCVGAESDVDEDDLKEFGDVTKIVKRKQFLFNKEDDAASKRTQYDLKRFLTEHLEVEMDAKTTVKEALAASVNHQCLGEIRYRADKNDPEVQYDEIGKTAPLE